MRYFAWDPALETGCTEIDDQHKSLFDLANALERAIDAELIEKAESDAVANAVYGLVGYVVEHFHDEEQLMARYGYPGAGPHRALHEQLGSQTLEIMARYTNEDDVEPTELAPLICDWLTNHIHNHDMSVVTFMERVDAAARAAAGTATPGLRAPGVAPQ